MIRGFEDGLCLQVDPIASDLGFADRPSSAIQTINSINSVANLGQGVITASIDPVTRNDRSLCEAEMECQSVVRPTTEVER